MGELTLTTSRKINATPEAVFNAWLDPEMLARFMMPGSGMTVPSVKTDAKVGGHFEIIMRVADQELPHGGEYKEITPHSRIVFTWQSASSVDDSTVTLRFTPNGDGTDVELKQVKFANEQMRDNHFGGWNNILSKLSEIL